MAQILIVDDDPAFRMVLRIVLEQEGHCVQDIGTSSEGITMLIKDASDIVLVDQMLVGLSGSDLITAVAAQHLPVEPSFVFISATRKFDTMVQTIPTAYPVHILHKPFEVNTLTTLLSAIQEERAAHSQAKGYIP
jgi:DNA-binding response OmpR family regulator